MSYDKEKIYKECFKIIEKEQILDIEELISFISPCSTTFYAWWPCGSEKSDTLKEEINNNKIKLKKKLKKKWELSDAPALQIALYKTIATDEEREKLNTTYQRNDITTKGEKISTNILSFVKTDEED